MVTHGSWCISHSQGMLVPSLAKRVITHACQRWLLCLSLFMTGSGAHPLHCFEEIFWPIYANCRIGRLLIVCLDHQGLQCTVKKRLAVSQSPAWMSITKLSLGGNNNLFTVYSTYVHTFDLSVVKRSVELCFLSSLFIPISNLSHLWLPACGWGQMACRLILGRCILPHLQGSPLTTKSQESSPTASILTTRHSMSLFPFQPITEK